MWLMPSILYLGQCAIISQCLVPVYLIICYSIYIYQQVYVDVPHLNLILASRIIQ